MSSTEPILCYLFHFPDALIILISWNVKFRMFCSETVSPDLWLLSRFSVSLCMKDAGCWDTWKWWFREEVPVSAKVRIHRKSGETGCWYTLRECDHVNIHWDTSLWIHVPFYSQMFMLSLSVISAQHLCHRIHDNVTTEHFWFTQRKKRKKRLMVMEGGEQELDTHPVKGLLQIFHFNIQQSRKILHKWRAFKTVANYRRRGCPSKFTSRSRCTMLRAKEKRKKPHKPH